MKKFKVIKRVLKKKIFSLDFKIPFSKNTSSKFLPQKIHFQIHHLRQYIFKIASTKYIFKSAQYKKYFYKNTFSKLTSYKLYFQNFFFQNTQNCCQKKTFWNLLCQKIFLFKKEILIFQNYFFKKRFLKNGSLKKQISLKKYFFKFNLFQKNTFSKHILKIALLKNIFSKLLS